MTDLVVISLEAWDGVWRRNQHLVSRLLDADPHLRVLFVEPVADPLHDVRSGRDPRFGRGVRERADVQPRLWTLQPLKLLPRRVDLWADKRFARTVARAARRIGMARPVLWVNDPGAAETSRVTGWPTLYDITDDWAVADRGARQQQRVVAGERYLLHHATHVVACSAELVARKSPSRPHGSPPIELIPNGVDVAAYRRPSSRPEDLPPGKTAVYVGTLHSDRLDVDLCVKTAQALGAEVSIVLVGPNLLGDAATGRLRDAGVVLLGAKPHEQVPPYLQHADALIVPHLVNEFTDSLDPIKLYEYQAAGRPVVATAVAGFRGADQVAIAAGDEFAWTTLRASSGHAGVPDRLLPEAPDWSLRARAFHTRLVRLWAEAT